MNVPLWYLRFVFGGCVNTNGDWVIYVSNSSKAFFIAKQENKKI
jgi:hypothetical protein